MVLSSVPVADEFCVFVATSCEDELEFVIRMTLVTLLPGYHFSALSNKAIEVDGVHPEPEQDTDKSWANAGGKTNNAVNASNVVNSFIFILVVWE